MGGKKIYELMVEIGHISKPLNKKLANGYTHKWTIFVRGNNNSKIEHCIQRVVFQLHESFTDPYRDISTPPFQIKETGYAGFEIPIEIYFKNKEKPNHLVFVHDLVLLTNKPNEKIAVEKIKFINPNKEFERCLIKAGAQLMPASIKKERSDSPPAKKHKPSSLIPSKDMNKQPPLITDLPSTLSSQQQTHSQSSSKDIKKEFLDVFGAPILYNKNKESSSSSNHTKVKHHHNHHNHHHHHGNSNNNTTSSSNNNNNSSNHNHHSHHHHSNSNNGNQNPLTQQQPSQSVQVTQKIQNNSQNQQYTNDLKLIQTKISTLTDCDRLQKIVDIIEEAGEPFNVTQKKFEFDLKRLDKKTLNKIEKCLH